ncbi:MAG: hypothetical protein J7555_03820 [Chloroflexi bacterium]|jgi:hypothetical protein|nr:hypothetical protein [Chloroflexota bacterium]
MAAPDTNRFANIDLLTSAYRAVGKVMVTHTGVIGLLNDATKSYIEIHDARLAYIHMPTKLVGHFEVLRLLKSQIFVVCAARREELGPLSLLRGGFLSFKEHPVFLTTQVYEVRGTLELPGKFDYSAVMFEGTRDFVPIYNALISAILFPTLRMESPAGLFNRKRVDFMGLEADRRKE